MPLLPDLTNERTTHHLVVRCGPPELSKRVSSWIDQDLGTADEIALPGGPLNLLDPAVFDQAVLLIELHRIKTVWLVEHRRCPDSRRLRRRTNQPTDNLARLFAGLDVRVRIKAFELPPDTACHSAPNLVWGCSDFRLRQHRRKWATGMFGPDGAYEMIMPGSGLALQRAETATLMHQHASALYGRGTTHVYDLRHVGCGAYVAFRDVRTHYEQMAAQMVDLHRFAGLEVHSQLEVVGGILEPNGNFVVPVPAH